MKIEFCPVCGNNNAEKVYDPFLVDNAKYQLVKCAQCSHHYTFYYSDIDIDKYYDALDYTVKDNRKSIFHKVQELEYKKVLNVISNYSSGRQLMDFGSGKGVFLSFAKEKGYAAVGVETSRPRAAYAVNSFGFEVSTDFFSGGQIFNRRFPIITMFHVLEHIPDAKELLTNLYAENLTPGGIAVIEVPNFGSWQSRWAGNRWLHIDIPRHVSHFTSASLRGLLHECNLQVVKTQTFSLHLGIIGMIQTLMSFFGYKGFLIGDLKTKRTGLLMVKVLFLLPFAFLLEGLSSFAGKGAVLRYYVKERKAVR